MDGKKRMFDVIQETLESDFPAWFSRVFSYASNPGLVLPFILLMVLAIYYLQSTSKSYKEANVELKKKLQTQNEENKKKNKRAALKAQMDLEEARKAASQTTEQQNNNNASPQDHEADEEESQSSSGERMYHETKNFQLPEPPFPGSITMETTALKGTCPVSRDKVNPGFTGCRACRGTEGVRKPLYILQALIVTVLESNEKLIKSVFFKLCIHDKH
ncbi:Transmembrane channel-like protein 1 [Larimichthys crocea]|uniref:Uncharacterized protein n=1 Tax=Larimichthys crocea TaxID=215358 RepID=A0ACD3Q927_LARCR|nr:Transmembrane channel-like protein 1 [Larimichthys crocea]